jgi:hypothetical protein
MLQRFMSKFSPEPNSGCWLWTAAISFDGYGIIGYDSHRSVGAHRVSYELFKGNIPKGLFVMHSCDNRCCVNPSHLSVGTAKANAHDMIAKGRGYSLR